jgi:hypothetical protein
MKDFVNVCKDCYEGKKHLDNPNFSHDEEHIMKEFEIEQKK